MSLLRRAVSEHRGVLVPLAIALAINIGVYALAVYPLGVKSATVVDRAAAAARERQSAERDMASAEALVTGKAKADQELATFYQKVLPSSLDEARRMTYARLPELARKADMRFDERHADVDPQLEKSSQLGRVRTRMVLEGGYDNVRRFLYELETTPEFIIVDDVSLGQSDPSKPVTVTLEVSTYYRQGRNGA